jgi:hypothetical protein
MKYSQGHEFGTNVVYIGGRMNGRTNIQEQIRDLAALNRHHDARMRWLVTQMSDDELKRLGLFEPDRDSDGWIDRVLRKMDEKLHEFMYAHARLLGAKQRVRKLRWLDRLQENLKLVGQDHDRRVAEAWKKQP